MCLSRVLLSNTSFCALEQPGLLKACLFRVWLVFSWLHKRSPSSGPDKKQPSYVWLCFKAFIFSELWLCMSMGSKSAVSQYHCFVILHHPNRAQACWDLFWIPEHKQFCGGVLVYYYHSKYFCIQCKSFLLTWFSSMPLENIVLVGLCTHISLLLIYIYIQYSITVFPYCSK